MPDLSAVGGDVALDLVNTVEPRVPGGPGREHLTSPEALLAWAVRVGVVREAEAAGVVRAWEPDGGAAALAAVLDLREAVYTTMLAVLGSGPDPGDGLAVLQRRWAEAASRSALALDSGADGRLRVGTRPGSAIVDRLATAAVDLVRTVDPSRLKACPLEEGGCGWLFLDRSRNGSRRWCSMADCGARVKADRLTERRRAARAARR